LFFGNFGFFIRPALFILSAVFGKDVFLPILAKAIRDLIFATQERVNTTLFFSLPIKTGYPNNMEYFGGKVEHFRHGVTFL